MNNNTYKVMVLLTIVSIFLVGSVLSADLIASAITSKTIDTAKVDLIKTRANAYLTAENKSTIASISVTIDNPECGNGYCLFYAHQEGVIDTQFKLPMTYTTCTLTNETTGECMNTQVNTYTDQELRDAADVYVEDRLNLYGGALQARQGVTPKSIGGEITITTK